MKSALRFQVEKTRRVLLRQLRQAHLLLMRKHGFPAFTAEQVSELRRGNKGVAVRDAGPGIHGDTKGSGAVAIVERQGARSSEMDC